MNLLFRGAACAPLLALLAGCCANNPNTCDDLQADSLFLVPANNRVNADTVRVSFTRAELDTVYLQRYAPATAARPATTTLPAIPAQPKGALSTPVSIVRAQQTLVNAALRRKLDAANLSVANTIVISNTVPFSPSTTGGKLNAYNYVLTIHDLSVKGAPTYVDTLVQIQFQGQYYADGCTTCYENTQKTFVLKGRNTTKTIDATEKEEKNDVKVAVPISITKLD
ncbi:MAG: hypothetical protein ACRYF0_10760 [Janthinobacterium lividum]